MENKLEVKCLYNDTPLGRTLEKNAAKELRECILLDPEKYPMPAELETYEDKIGTAYNLVFGVKKCRYAKSFINYELQTIMGHGFSKLSDMWNFATATNQLMGGAVNKDGTMNKAKLLTLNIIGRSDLRPKSMKYEDVLNYLHLHTHSW